MSNSRRTNSIGRLAGRLVFAAAALVVAGRLVQLSGDDEAGRLPNPPLASPYKAGEAGYEGAQKADTDAELARLYAVCPMATVVDFETVSASPETVDALLPPYAPTADRQVAGPIGPVEPAVPRIRYPLSVRPELRIAALPEPSPGPSLQGTGGGLIDSRQPGGDWLIDPREWYAPDKQAPVAASPIPPDEKTAPDANSPESPTSKPAKPQESVGVHSPELERLPHADDVVDLDELPSLDPPVPPQDSPPLPAESNPNPEVQPVAPPEAAVAPVTPIETLPTQAGSLETLFAPPPTAAPTHPSVPTPPPSAAPSSTKHPAPGVDPHLELFAKNAYPSARECAECHEDIYHEWSMSAHAYAAVSPMFHKFEQKLNDLSQGTVGYFCMRCHAPVATALGASRAEPLWNLPEVAREGVTCIACHRVQYVYGKSNGERRIEPGNVFAPVMGGIGGHGVAETIHRREHFKVKTSSEEQGPGQNIHVEGIYFDPLTRSEFCTPCHQVAVHPGIKLEVVWEQYRASPACKKGIQCQDCHMGKVPGLPHGYATGPVAMMAGKTVNDHRKKSNHIFYGPNYPIAHPGIFPFHLKANRWTMPEWLEFDWRAGWGTEEFENLVAEGKIQACFPACWAEADDRFDAREIIEDNFKKLQHKRDIRIEVMENGSRVQGPFFDSPLVCGQDLRFHYVITNTNEGHNLLTASLGAQPQYWANVVLIGPHGGALWETGYLDSYGDLANIHSLDVRNKRLRFDSQLFNLQTMFLITGAKGTDREFFVPVNLDIDQLPFIRPGVQPISVINHPPFIRMESQSLAPLGSRRANYHVPGHLMQQPGTYRLAFRMRSRAEPMYFMRFCEATPEMERAMIEWMVDVHPMTVEFTVR